MALKFQQNDSVLLGRVLPAALLVVSLVMVTVYSREGDEGPLHVVQSVVSNAVSPLRIVGAAAGAGTETISTAIGDITADESTLSGLRDYNAELVELYSQMEEYRQEAQRLESLLELSDTYGFTGTGARVIGRSSEAWSQTITIDKGSADGIETGLTVMGTSGVVGQVASVADSTSVVRLLTDPQSGAAALVQSSRAEGIVRGSFSGLLYLEDLDGNAEVAVGDIVLTSGLGGSYQSGLLIGTVVKVEGQQGDASRTVVVSSNDTVSSLEEVMVVSSVASDDSSDEGGDGS